MIKQYVNLEYNADEHQGHRISVEVASDQLGEDDIRYAEWWVDPVGGNNADEKYLGRSSRAHTRYVNTRNQHDKFRNTVYVPHVGGDKYKVCCSKRGDRSSPVELEEIETWRKIFYTVHYMNNNCLQIFNRVKGRMKAAFEEGFVELEEVTVSQTLADEPMTRSSNSLSHLYHRNPRLRDRPFHLRIVVVNDLFDPEDNEYIVPGVNAKVTNIATVDPLWRDGTRWRRRARARVEPSGHWQSISRYTTATSDYNIEVDLTGHAQLSRAIDNGQTLRIEIRTRERGHYLGHSIGNFCCVRINESGSAAQVETTILQTFTHEIGHGFQQVVRRERTYDNNGSPNGWENNPKWHGDSEGGQGPHCSTNAKKVASANTTSGQIWTHDSGTLCTMFFRDDAHVDANGEFCDNCKPRLKRVSLSASEMRAQGWGRY